MASTALAIALFILISFEYPRAEGALSSWGNRVVDCGVSIWSAWSEVSGSNSRTRSREIFRFSKNGGAPCPSLTETTGVPLDADPFSRQNVPQKFHNSFLTGSIYRDDSASLHKFRRRRQDTIQPRDTLFIIDMSGSIKTDEFELAKKNLADLIGLICGSVGPMPHNNRVAVITFASKVVYNFNFEKYFTIEGIKQAIRALPQSRKSTCTGDAIAFAHNSVFVNGQGLRPAGQSIKEVLVITDGDSNCGANIKTESGKLRLKAFVFALAISDGITKKGQGEIRSMATKPLIHHIFSLKNFDKFEEMVVTATQHFKPCIPFDTQ